jgi:hypothetical protein
MLKEFLKVLLRELKHVEVHKLKYWRSTHSGVTIYSVDVTFELLGTRVNVVAQYDGETITIVDGDIILDALIRDMWARIMTGITVKKGTKPEPEPKWVSREPEPFFYATRDNDRLLRDGIAGRSGTVEAAPGVFVSGILVWYSEGRGDAEVARTDVETEYAPQPEYRPQFKKRVANASVEDTVESYGPDPRGKV